MSMRLWPVAHYDHYDRLRTGSYASPEEKTTADSPGGRPLSAQPDLPPGLIRDAASSPGRAPLRLGGRQERQPQNGSGDVDRMDAGTGMG
jgi:hypothetical protein